VNRGGRKRKFGQAVFVVVKLSQVYASKAMRQRLIVTFSKESLPFTPFLFQTFLTFYSKVLKVPGSILFCREQPIPFSLSYLLTFYGKVLKVPGSILF